MIALFLAVAPAAAQTTNLSLFQDMAVSCLGELPSGIDRVVVVTSDDMPYVRSALVSTWRADGHEVFLDGSLGDRVAYDVEEATVTYARAGRDLARDARLTLVYTVSAADGRVLADERCAQRRTGVIARDALTAVQTPAYPETQAEAPRGGWLRRVLEPAVLTAATAVAVYLFFSLRTTGEDT